MRLALALAFLLGCPPADEGETNEQTSTTTGGEGETEVVVERVEEEEGEREVELADEPTVTTCTSSRDCPEGQQCFGEAGCDVQWTCQEPRPCTRDLVTYCGCSGETVQGSGSCPPEPYSRRGACE